MVGRERGVDAKSVGIGTEKGGRRRKWSRKSWETDVARRLGTRKFENHAHGPPKLIPVKSNHPNRIESPKSNYREIGAIDIQVSRCCSSPEWQRSRRDTDALCAISGPSLRPDNARPFPGRPN